MTRTIRIWLAVLAVVLALLGFSRIREHEESPAVGERAAGATEEAVRDATRNDIAQSSKGDPPGPGSAGRPAGGASRGRQGSSTAKGSQSTESLPEGTIPQGFEIAFTRHGANGVRPSSAVSLYLVNAAGSDLRKLAPSGAEPGWSPDGKFIAFSDADGSGGNSPSEVGEIRFMNADGSGVQRLGFWGFSPTWSPDGGQLAFGWACRTQSASCEEELWWGGSDPNEECGPECGIGVVARDGSGRRHLGTGIWPDWGPDGRIMFADGAPNAPCYYDQGTGWTRSSGLPWCELPIWVVNPDGSGRTRLPIDKAIRPTWSPDGRRIAYSTAINEIFIANSDGTGIVRVAPGGREFSQPSWSPDGLWLALRQGGNAYNDYTGTPRGNIYLRRIDGSAERRLTAGEADILPAFSPRR